MPSSYRLNRSARLCRYSAMPSSSLLICDQSAGQAQQGSQISSELEGMAEYLHSLAERFSR